MTRRISAVPCSIFAGAIAAALAIHAPALAQIPGQNPDWLCAQRLVQKLEPGSYWNGPAIPDYSAWRDNEAVFDLANTITDRDTSDADALKQLGAYADNVPADQREKAYPFLFGALVDQTNDERQILIARIEQLGHRQNEMGGVIAKLDEQVDKTKGTDAEKADLVGKRDFDIRAFREAQFTMRYACEAPANMERRLGEFARLLTSKLASGGK